MRNCSPKLQAIAFAALLLMSPTLKGANGTVVAWGNNGLYNLNIPGDLTNAVAIDAGIWFGFALSGDGRPVGWGYYYPGTPANVGNVVAVAGGGHHCLALRSDGTVAAWGQNNYGQTNVPPSLTNVIAVAAGDSISGALKSDGTVVCWGAYGAAPPGLSNVVSLVAGDYHFVALKRDRTVVVWGNNGNGQLNLPDGMTNVVAVAAGFLHSLALKEDGKVETWGFTSIVPPGLSNVVALSAGGFNTPHCAALFSDRTVLSWGGGAADPAPPGISNAAAISCGNQFDLALIDSAPVVVVRQPIDEIVYSGTTARFNVGAASPHPLFYQWRKNGANLPGETNSILHVPNVQTAQAGLYTVLASNDLGSCLSSKATLQVVHAAPIVVREPPDPLLAPGPTAMLSVDASGSLPLSYQWRCNGTNVPNATNSTLEFLDLHDSNVGFYDLVITNLYGAITNRGTHLLPVSLPVALDAIELEWTTSADFPWFAATNSTHDGMLAGRSGSISQGQQSILQTHVTGPGALTFWCGVDSQQAYLKFSIDGVQQFLIPGSNTGWQYHSYLLGDGQHTLEWSFSTPNANSPTAAGWVDQVSYVPGPTLPTFSLTPTDQTVPAGKNVSFNASVFGTPPLSYQWQFKSQNLSGSTNTSLAITNVQAKDTGTYTLVVTNGYGTTNWNGTLTVLPASPTIFMQPPLQRVTVNSAARFVVVAEGTEPFSYQWQLNETNINSATNPVFGLERAQLSDGGNYRVVVSNSISVTTSSNSLLIVSPTVVVAWGAGTNISFQPHLGQSIIPLTLTNSHAVSAGGFHGLSLGNNGLVSGWGDNTYKQIDVPPGLSNVIAISAGGYHSLALTSDGTVWGWGAGTNITGLPRVGQARIPAGLSNVTAIAAGFYHSLALKADGSITAWGYNNFGQTNLPAGLTNLVGIACGSYHSLAIDDFGNVFAWGAGKTNTGTTPNFGQAAVPGGLSNVVAIAAGNYHSLALRSDGTVICWGRNFSGLTNVPPSLTNIISIACGGDHNLALSDSGILTVWGNNTYRQTNAPSGLSNVVAISGGADNSLALLNDGSAFISRQSLSRDVPAGKTVVLEVVVPGPAKYQWQRNGFDILDETNAILGLTNSSTTQSGTYQCSASNFWGGSTSLPMKLNVFRTTLQFDLTSPPRLTAAGFETRIKGLSGHGPIDIYTSDNLIDWIPAKTNPPTVGSLDIEDNSATNRSQLFYQVREE